MVRQKRIELYIDYLIDLRSLNDNSVLHMIYLWQIIFSISAIYIYIYICVEVVVRFTYSLRWGIHYVDLIRFVCIQYSGVFEIWPRASDRHISFMQLDTMTPASDAIRVARVNCGKRKGTTKCTFPWCTAALDRSTPRMAIFFFVRLEHDRKKKRKNN